MRNASLHPSLRFGAGAVLVTFAAGALVGCSDWRLQNREPHTEVPADTGEQDTAPPNIPEDCNGVDDDGDGRVDEGHDEDFDNVPDCWQCVPPFTAASEHDEAHTCAVEPAPPKDPWNVEVLWEYSPPWKENSGWGCRVTSIADLDADGIAEVLCASWQLYVLDGATGEVEWSTDRLGVATPTAVADVDGDGAPEVVGIGYDGPFVALDGDGTVEWVGDAYVGSTDPYKGQATSGTLLPLEVADLDADGTVEIVNPHGIASGVDGETLVELDSGEDFRDYAPREVLPVDVDGDGVQEIAERWSLYSATGTVVWSIEPPMTWGYSALTLPFQLDSDGDTELAILSDARIDWVDSSGTLLRRDSLRSAGESGIHLGACTGDLDGDGHAEILIASGTDRELAARTADGDVLWAFTYQDVTEGHTFCSTFDFDLDGAQEVVFSDMAHVYILNGRTGTPLWTDDGQSSTTFGELALMADLDGDGSVEIVQSTPACERTADADKPCVRVFGNVNRDWPPGLPMWTSQTWSGTSVQSDFSVPRYPRQSWMEWGFWRGQPSAVVTGADLAAEVLDSCVSDIELDDAEVHLAVRVLNLGPEERRAGIPIAVYRLTEDGGRELTEQLETTDYLLPGQASGTVDVELTRGELEYGVVVVAGDDGTGVMKHDCDTTNNEVTWQLEE